MAFSGATSVAKASERSIRLGSKFSLFYPRDVSTSCDSKGLDERGPESCKIEMDVPFGKEDGEFMLKDLEAFDEKWRE